VYCTAKTNSQGCVPHIGASGPASATSAAACFVTASQVINNKTGTLFYGVNGRISVPFQGGFNCVATPRRRTLYQSSAGNAPPDDCSGAFSFDFKARIQSGVDPALVVGAHVDAQYWSRDPVSASTTNLTDAVELVICPR
jgi:hypothetical protein